MQIPASVPTDEYLSAFVLNFINIISISSGYGQTECYFPTCIKPCSLYASFDIMTMKLISLSLVVLLNNISVAQDQSLLQGKWKIISAKEDHIYYNLITDSIFLPKEVLNEIYKDGHDSSFAVELYKSILGSLKNYRFSFDKDSVCLESETAKSKGVYHINNSKDSIDLLIPMSAGASPQRLRYGYTIRNNVLTFIIPMDNYYRTLVLHKQ